MMQSAGPVPQFFDEPDLTTAEQDIGGGNARRKLRLQSGGSTEWASRTELSQT